MSIGIWYLVSIISYVVLCDSVVLYSIILIILVILSIVLFSVMSTNIWFDMVVFYNSMSSFSVSLFSWIIVLINTSYSIIIIWSNIAVTSISFMLVYSSFGINVIIIYILIQETGSLVLLIVIIVSVNIGIWVVMVYNIGLPPFVAWGVILVEYFIDTHLLVWIITLQKLSILFLYVNCISYIIEISFNILLNVLLLIFTCTSVIDMIVYSSCFINILIIYSSLYSIELIILWVILYGITIWVLFYGKGVTIYLINFVILLFSMPISFIFYINY